MTVDFYPFTCPFSLADHRKAGNTQTSTAHRYQCYFLFGAAAFNRAWLQVCYCFIDHLPIGNTLSISNNLNRCVFQAPGGFGLNVSLFCFNRIRQVLRIINQAIIPGACRKDLPIRPIWFSLDLCPGSDFLRLAFIRSKERDLGLLSSTQQKAFTVFRCLNKTHNFITRHHNPQTSFTKTF